jgi:hypothetical protein
VATAPTQHQADVAAGRTAVTQDQVAITIRANPNAQVPRAEDETRILAVGNLPMGERMAVRKQVGLPFDGFWAGEGTVGLDSVAVLWWLAARADGARSYSWAEAARDWPDDLNLSELEVVVLNPRRGRRRLPGSLRAQFVESCGPLARIYGIHTWGGRTSH